MLLLKNALRHIVQDQPAGIVATLPHSLSQEFPNLSGALTAHPAVSILQQLQRSVKSFLRSTMKEDRLVGLNLYFLFGLGSILMQKVLLNVRETDDEL